MDEVGDRWSLLIVWAAANGTSRFDDFHRDLSVARNILSNRLRRLVDLGILEKRPVRDGARRMEYALTRKGDALRAVLHGLLDWGDSWAKRGPGNAEGRPQ
ncbi:helix-turn-helix domain-containing protein [uncultured Albimonas sp.]|uniref:winged helix-turn-helix transcriptional regulator n=1 Tax=uncultured Albimonas sp. TaxID=1331701 RepID=UPI0030ED0EA6